MEPHLYKEFKRLCAMPQCTSADIVDLLRIRADVQELCALELLDRGDATCEDLRLAIRVLPKNHSSIEALGEALIRQVDCTKDDLLFLILDVGVVKNRAGRALLHRGDVTLDNLAAVLEAVDRTELIDDVAARMLHAFTLSKHELRLIIEKVTSWTIRNTAGDLLLQSIAPDERESASKSDVLLVFRRVETLVDRAANILLGRYELTDEELVEIILRSRVNQGEALDWLLASQHYSGTPLGTVLARLPEKTDEAFIARVVKELLNRHAQSVDELITVLERVPSLQERMWRKITKHPRADATHFRMFIVDESPFKDRAASILLKRFCNLETMIWLLKYEHTFNERIQRRIRWRARDPKMALMLKFCDPIL